MRLLVIADDFTGALDTGVQFAKVGTPTRVLMNMAHGLSAIPRETEVLIVNTESRHVSPEEAARRVSTVIQQVQGAGHSPIYYKKTDSGLRGNIGAELTEMLHTVRQGSLYFLPAFPRAGRTTEKGVQYIDGVPVADTVFGKDPFNPVLHSSIGRVIAEQSDVPVQLVSADDDTLGQDAQPSGIVVIDAKEDGDISSAAKALLGAGATMLAGCAGFAEHLSEQMKLKKEAPSRHIVPGGMIIISGSVNPITIEQTRYARAHGFQSLSLTREQKFTPGYADSEASDPFVKEALHLYRAHRRLIIEPVDSARAHPEESGYVAFAEGTNASMRKVILRNIGGIVGKLLRRERDAVYVFIGGDTLVAAMSAAGCTQITPISEIAPGVVFAVATNGADSMYIVTKSGGFGTEEVFLMIEAYLGRRQGKEMGREVE